MTIMNLAAFLVCFLVGRWIGRREERRRAESERRKYFEAIGMIARSPRRERWPGW